MKAAATALDVKAKTVALDDGRSLGYGALILATGAEPIRLPIPGADLPHVHVLRSLADSRAILERQRPARAPSWWERASSASKPRRRCAPATSR